MHHVALHRSCCTHLSLASKHLRATPSAKRQLLQVGHEQNLAAWLGHCYRENTDRVYGGGFRRALDAFQAIGLKPLMQHVAQHGTLPDCTPA